VGGLRKSTRFGSAIGPGLSPGYFPVSPWMVGFHTTGSALLQGNNTCLWDDYGQTRGAHTDEGSYLGPGREPGGCALLGALAQEVGRGVP